MRISGLSQTQSKTTYFSPFKIQTHRAETPQRSATRVEPNRRRAFVSLLLVIYTHVLVVTPVLFVSTITSFRDVPSTVRVIVFVSAFCMFIVVFCC